MVDIYPMMCHILGLQNPGPNNGSFERIAFVFKTLIKHENWVYVTPITCKYHDDAGLNMYVWISMY